MALPSKSLRDGERVRLAGADTWKITSVSGNIVVTDSVENKGDDDNPTKPRSTALAEGESHEVAETGDVYVLGIDGGGRYAAEAGPQDDEAERHPGFAGRQENDRVGPTAHFATDAEADFYSPSRRTQLRGSHQGASRVVAKDAQAGDTVVVGRRESDLTGSGETVSDRIQEVGDGAYVEPEGAGKSQTGSGPYKTRTLKELRATAKEKGLSGYSSYKKDKLVRELQKAK